MTNTKRALQSAIETLYLAWKICADEDYMDTFKNAANECKAALSEIEKYEPIGVVDEVAISHDGKHIFNAVGKVNVGDKLYRKICIHYM